MLGLGSPFSSGALALGKSLLSLGLFLTRQNEETSWVTHSPRHCGRLCHSEGALGISSSPLQTGLPSRPGLPGASSLLSLPITRTQVTDLRQLSQPSPGPPPSRR